MELYHIDQLPKLHDSILKIVEIETTDKNRKYHSTDFEVRKVKFR